MKYDVLYVDDDEANLTVFEAAFGDEFAVHTSTRGKDALEFLGTNEVAVLLTDQRMPDMLGSQLAEKVKTQHPCTLRYLLTAYSDLAGAIDAINKGEIHRYLQKPWNHDQLRVVLREGIELYDTRAEVRQLKTRLGEVERVYALGVVAASVAHEIRGPISALCGGLELAIENTQRLRASLAAAGEPGSAVSEVDNLSANMGLALDAAHSIIEIVNGISLNARSHERGGSADLGEVVRLTLRLVRNEMNRRKTDLDLQLDDCAPVRGAPTKLGQVVLNLITNALEAIPPDHGRSDMAVRIRMQQKGDVVRLEVIDRGPGIPADIQNRIFDPFFTTKKAGGTGLGLAISKQIVEECGGRLEVESTPGQGACFRVTLPLAAAAVKPAFSKASA